jgi:hypothetical protein
MAAHNGQRRYVEGVCGNEEQIHLLCASCRLTYRYGKAIETNYPNSVEGMTKGLSHITSILEGIN